jgi:hypothetical protein
MDSRTLKCDERGYERRHCDSSVISQRRFIISCDALHESEPRLLRFVRFIKISAEDGTDVQTAQ